MITNVSDKIKTRTRGIPAPGSKGSGLANTATIARTKIKVGMDSVTLKYMVMTESIQPRTVAQWRKEMPSLHKRPTLFALFVA